MLTLRRKILWLEMVPFDVQRYSKKYHPLSASGTHCNSTPKN